MRQLRHKNIVKLLDFIESPDNYYIVLELVPGGELFHQIVRLTYFSEDLSRHVIIQVAEAVRYLHEEAGVVHRDIKPENLLFYPTTYIPSSSKKVRAGDDGESKEDEGVFIAGSGAGGIGAIKLADFGLSKIIWDSKTKTPCGTVGYTAPEIVNDQRYSKSVDMWALGCVLYTILCGFPPFYDEDVKQLIEKVARGQYTFLSPWWDDISASAKDLVAHLLTVDPEQRYTIDQFFAHPWITQSNNINAASFCSQSQKMTSAVAPDEPVIHSMPVSEANSYFGGIADLPQPNSDPVITKPIGPTQLYDIQGPTARKTYPKTPIPAAAGGKSSKQEAPTAHLVIPADFYVPERAYMSPAVVAMRGAFDVFNAVHRQEEESGTRGYGHRDSIIGKDQVLNELEEEEEEETKYEKPRKGSVTYPQHRYENYGKQRNGLDKLVQETNEQLNKLSVDDNKSPKSKKSLSNQEPADSKFFELNLSGSTLIERRKQGPTEEESE